MGSIKTIKLTAMKLPKYIRSNWWYINRVPLFYITVGFCFIVFCATFVLNLIEFITNFINTL